jgi:hypothetical protein
MLMYWDGDSVLSRSKEKTSIEDAGTSLDIAYAWQNPTYSHWDCEAYMAASDSAMTMAASIADACHNVMRSSYVMALSGAVSSHRNKQRTENDSI